METFVFHLMPYQDVEGDAWPWQDDAYDPEKGSEYFRQYLAQMEHAAELGFDGLGVNEHHYSAYGLQPSPMVTGSNLAARTEDTSIAFFGNIPAIRGNPIRLAEELAMLDNVTEGRIISGFARGIPSEYLAYNVPLEESRSRHEEAWDLIVKAWTAEEPFDWDGDHWQYENVNIWPRPYQQPHPELWMPAESEKSLRFAAERQIPIGTGFEDELGAAFRTYRQFAEEEHGWSPGDEHFTYGGRVYVAETTEQAHEEARDHLERFYRTFFSGIHLGVAARQAGDDVYDPDNRDAYEAEIHPHADDTLSWDFDDHVDDLNVLVGTPAEVVQKVKALYDAVGGFGRFVAHFHFADMAHEKAMRNLELYADEVKPEVDKIGDLNP